MRLHQFRAGWLLPVLCLILLGLPLSADAVTITWTGVKNNSWHTPENWDLERLPNTDDDVRIPNQVNPSITHSSAVTTRIRSLECHEVLEVSAGTIQIGEASIITNTFRLVGGTFTGTGNLSLTGGFLWTGGTMGGSGVTTIPNGVFWNVDPGGSPTLTRLLVSNGSGSITTTFVITSPGILRLGVGGFVSLSDVSVNGTGLIDVQASGTLSKAGFATGSINCTLTNNGTVNVALGTLFVNGFTNYSAGTLTGGVYDIEGILRYDSGEITTLAASIILDGSGQIQDSGSQNAIRNLGQITSTGALTLDNGKDVSTNGDLSNSGTVTIRSATSTLSIDDGYSQHFGQTILDGGTIQSTQGISIVGGALRGNGTVAGQLINDGTVSPGMSAGSITVNGTYVQTSGGSLEIEVGGTTPGSGFDRLTVSGSATLNGHLDVALINGFTFPDGINYTIMTFSSRSGTFATDNLPTGMGVECVDVAYTTTTVRLMNTPCPDTLFVNATAPPGGDGQGWGTAFNDLQSALTTAAGHGGFVDIWVARGTYKPSVAARNVPFTLRSKVALYGGFFGNESQRSERRPELWPAILSGDLAGNDGPDFLNNTENSLNVVRGSSADSTAILDGFTVQGGNANQLGSSDGGGLIVSGSGRPTIVDCILSGNAANSSGGGIMLALGGSARIIGCTFSGNKATIGGALNFTNGTTAPLLETCQFIENEGRATGGAVVIGSTAMTIKACEFIDNRVVTTSTGNGGALSISGSSTVVTLLDCIFTGNEVALSGTASGTPRGGAVAIQNGGTAVMTRCLFMDNHISSGSGAIRGGAVGLLSTTATFNECRFLGNSAESGGEADGGAVAFLSTNAGGTFVNCIFSGNHGSHESGAVEVNGTGTTHFRNCSFSRNTAGTSVGGIRVSSSGPVQVLNCVLWGNRVGATETQTSQIAFSGSALPSSTINRSIVLGWNGTLGGVGNLSQDPDFVDPDGLDDVAGTIDDFLQLLPTSPGIDSGNDSSVPAGTTLDLAGRNRFQDDLCTPDTGDGVAPIVDRGAYEFQGDCVSGVGDPPSTSVPTLLVGHPSPNPFQDATTVAFELPMAGFVTVDVFDISGRKVSRLTERDLQAGTQSVRWDGTDERGRRVTAGLYFLRIEAPGGSATRKIVIR